MAPSQQVAQLPPLKGIVPQAGPGTEPKSVIAKPGIGIFRSFAANKAENIVRKPSSKALPQLLSGDEYAENFKEHCRRRYGCMARAWRLLLDPGGVGRVPFLLFCRAASSLGFVKFRDLWTHLNPDGSSFLTLDEWDPVAFRHLMEFRQICITEFGGMDEAFRYGMDPDGSGMISLEELMAFLKKYQYLGDPDELWKSLAEDRGGASGGGRVITKHELAFLTSWQGEHDSHALKQTKVERRVILANEMARGRRAHKEKVLRDKERVAKELKELEERRAMHAHLSKQSTSILQGHHAERLAALEADRVHSP